jgi:hypothetical protein
MKLKLATLALGLSVVWAVWVASNRVPKPTPRPPTWCERTWAGDLSWAKDNVPNPVAFAKAKLTLDAALAGRPGCPQAN